MSEKIEELKHKLMVIGQNLMSNAIDFEQYEEMKSEILKEAILYGRTSALDEVVPIIEKELLNIPYSQKIMDGGMLDEEMVSRNRLKTAIISIERSIGELVSLIRSETRG